MRTLTRNQAIDEIRTELLKLVDDEHSACEVCAQKGIFCRGFRQFSDEKLFERYRWIVDRRGVQTREALEGFANRWQLARQYVQNKELACDVQTLEHDTCNGWDTFSNSTLARHHHDLCGGDPVSISG